MRRRTAPALIAILLLSSLSACAQLPPVALPVTPISQVVANPESTTAAERMEMNREQSDDRQGMGNMEGMSQFTTDELAPLVMALYKGGEVFFIHTEASDPQVAGMLTEMMGPQVVVVPQLADVPKDQVSSIYVFTNGVEGMGPMGFQPDIFSTVPGDEAYTPLVEIHRVAWQEGITPRVLQSVEELQASAEAGEVTIQPSGVVVNAPVLVWPDGHR